MIKIEMKNWPPSITPLGNGKNMTNSGSHSEHAFFERLNIQENSILLNLIIVHGT